MAYEVKFGYISGYSMVFTVFQPEGTGRGIPDQPLSEVRPTGYYWAIPLTDLVVGDMVLAYILENVYWENDPVVVLTPEYVFWEDDRVYYEEDWVISFDSISSEIVTWAGNPIGAGEYLANLNEDGSSKLDTIVENTGRTVYVYDETVKPETVVILRNL